MGKLLVAMVLALPLPGRAQTAKADVSQNASVYFNNGYSLLPAGYPATAAAGSVLHGSCYLLPAWVPATIVLVGNRNASTVPLKYDIYRQELQVRRSQGDSVLVPLWSVQEFTLQPATGARRFVCYPAAQLPAPAAATTCGEILTGGQQVQLVKVWRRTIVQQRPAGGAYGSGTVENHLENQSQ